MIKLVSSNNNVVSSDSVRDIPQTIDSILDFMRKGYACIRRDEPDGFYYLWTMDGQIVSINQRLAEEVIDHVGVIREDYRAGWTTTAPTGETRWVIFWENER